MSYNKFLKLIQQKMESTTKEFWIEKFESKIEEAKNSINNILKALGSLQV